MRSLSRKTTDWMHLSSQQRNNWYETIEGIRRGRHPEKNRHGRKLPLPDQSALLECGQGPIRDPYLRLLQIDALLNPCASSH